MDADQPSPEFLLVCAACQWPRERRDAAVRAAAVRAAAVEGLDWERVAAIAKRQRVWGLVADALRSAGVSVPEAIGTVMQERGGRIARQNLAAVAETARLGAMLDAAGIDWVTFKGLALAIQAYGTLSIKMANDIDILVPVADTARACALLREAGYQRFSPGAEVADDQVAAWMQVSKESGWQHAKSGLIVELHGRLMANPALLPEAAIGMPRKRVAIAPGIEVPTMGDALLYPYLFAHGAHHGWFRLKWLADVAALITHEGPEGAEKRYREARALGVGRCAAQGLLLMHDLLGLPLAEAFVAELRADPVHRKLVEVAMAAVAGRFEAEEHASPFARTMLPVLFASLLLRRGLGYKWRELMSLAANPVDRATGRLPRGLGFLYPVLGIAMERTDAGAAGTTLSRAARIKSILGGSAGNLVEWYDWYAYAAFASYFAPHFFPDDAAKTANAWAIFAVGFFMRPIGGWLMGVYGDRRGRKAGLTLSVTLMCAGSLLIAVTPSYQSIGWLATAALLIARLMQGLSVGGEYGASATYLSEMAGRRNRGFWSSFQYVTLISGQLVSLCVLLVLQSTMAKGDLAEWGWRIPFAIGGVLAVLVYYLRQRLPETESYEKRAVEQRSSVGDLLLKHPREAGIVMLLTAGGTLAFYAYSIYLLTFLNNTTGFTKEAATQVNAGALFVFMCIQPLAGALSDRIGRKPLMIGFGVLGLVLTYPIFVALEGCGAPFTAFLLMTGALVIVTGYTSINAVVKAELFPAHIRTLGVALPYALANAIFGGTAPNVALWFKGEGWERGFYWYVTAMIGISLVTYITMRDTQRESLILED